MVVAVAGVIVFFAAHRGRDVGAHIIDTDAPGYRPAPEACLMCAATLRSVVT